jgi:hypothetical protein
MMARRELAHATRILAWPNTGPCTLALGRGTQVAWGLAGRSARAPEV